MTTSSISTQLTLPFPEYKWLWATWTVREIYKNPAIWMQVLRVMNRFEGMEYGINTPSGRLFHEALGDLGLRDDNGELISFMQPDRSFLRGYQTYWTNTGVLIPPERNGNRIGLTPLGKAIARGRMSFKQYVEYMIKKFQLPNPITQSRETLQAWEGSNVAVKPLEVILRVLLDLYGRAGFQNAYITEREAAILIYPLSATMTPQEIGQEIMAWRERDPSFNLNYMYTQAVSEGNEFRNVKEFLQFLSAGEILIATEMQLSDFNVNRTGVTSGQFLRTCYYLNLFGSGQWGQFSTTMDRYNYILELCEDANNAGFFNLDLTVPQTDLKSAFIDFLNDGITQTVRALPRAFDPEVEECMALLKESKQIILSGPPGIGKTRMALQIAEKLESDGELAEKEMILFHQSSSYEDFIEGIRPNVESSSLSYSYKHGIFKLLCRKAETNPDQYYILIIDEINRGNVSNIFGELIFLLEPSYRHPDYAVELQYTGDRLWVPANLLIIGTMNSTDKSAVDLDLALRRRFSIINLYPNAESITRALSERGVEIIMPGEDGANRETLNMANVLNGLNSIISRNIGLGEDFQFGQAFLLPHEGKEYDDAFILNAWNYKIIPLLNEYAHLSPSILGEISDMGFIVRNGRVQHFVLADLYAAMRQLSGIIE